MEKPLLPKNRRRVKSARAALRRLDKLTKTSSPIIKTLRDKYGFRIRHLEADNKQQHGDNKEGDDHHVAEYRRLRLQMIAAERAEVVRLRDEDVIGDDVMRRIQEDLDLEEVLLSSAREDADESERNRAK